MFFNELQENYTKVSYRKSCEPVKVSVLTSSAFKRSVTKLLPAFLVAGTVYFNLDASAYASAFSDKAEKLYFTTFMDIAKWVIIIKGGWDIVIKTLKEDFEGAKKCIVQYLLIFAVLMGLPWALSMVEGIFEEEV